MYIQDTTTLLTTYTTLPLLLEFRLLLGDNGIKSFAYLNCLRIPKELQNIIYGIPPFQATFLAA